MEPEMDSLLLQDNCEHQMYSEASRASDVIHDDPPVGPFIGSEHQAEIPNLATEDERRQLAESSLYSCELHGFDFPNVIGLAIPVTWESQPPSEANKEDEKLQTCHSLESESRDNTRDKESQLASICSNCNDTSECYPSNQDRHAVLPVDQIEPEGNQVYDEKLDPCFNQECLNLTGRPMVQQRETEQFAPLPGSSTSLWTALEEECFLLGLYIFGKNLNVLSKFVESKTVGDMLCYYYGKFYGRDAYKKWSHCRKMRTSRCILGERIFTGRRQQELISRLKSKISKEDHDSLLEVFKSFSDGRTSLEECVFTLKSTTGTETFLEVIGIGKGKHDLTGFVQDTSKTNQFIYVNHNMPTGKNCSSLASEDIIKFLSGDFRRSKTKTNDLFWEAVWPRLLACGWHSEQPKDVRTTKNSLVFLVPGIEKFARRKLTKGTHYFDSIIDILKKVVADPSLLDLEVDGTDNGATVHKNGWATGQDDPLDDDKELPKFTIIDTSLVQVGECFKVREFRSLPADANISFGPSNHSDSIVSGSSSQDQDGDDSSSNVQEDHGRLTTHANGINTVSVYNTGKESPPELLENMGTAKPSVFQVNGHSSDDQNSGIFNGNGDKIDSACFSGLRTKAEKRVYLSPVSKHRRLARCSNDQTIRHSLLFSHDDGLERHKIEPITTSANPTSVDAGAVFQTITKARCSKEKPCEQIANGARSPTNGGSHEKRSANISESASFDGKVDTLARAQSKIEMNATRNAKEKTVTSLIGPNKLETPPDNEASMSIHMTSSEKHGCAMADEAPSISNSEMIPDVLGAVGKPDVTFQVMIPRRHGTRHRPPTAKALEAVALGLLGGAKRKADQPSLTTSRPRQRARRNAD
ncbi:hypothetical protein ABZP36_018366 [Zizania latifolia]